VTEGVGIDLLEISRLEQALRRRPRLAERLFTAAELDYANARGRPGRHLAARFAAKEAVIKALAPAGGIPPRQIEVTPGEPPAVRLHGAAAAAASGVELRVSLTHSREFAAAVAVAERP
jgi:holo-[acyl-carrier protein] synthase